MPPSLGKCSKSLLFPFLHAFIHFCLPKLQFLGKVCVFVKIFWLLFVKLVSYDHALHFMLILPMGSCILGLCACLNNVSVVRLDWVSTYDAFYLCTTHVHAFSCITRSYSFFLAPKRFCCVSILLSVFLVWSPYHGIQKVRPFQKPDSSWFFFFFFSS